MHNKGKLKDKDPATYVSSNFPSSTEVHKSLTGKALCKYSQFHAFLSYKSTNTAIQC